MNCTRLLKSVQAASETDKSHVATSLILLQKAVPESMVRIFRGHTSTATLVPWDMLSDTPGSPPGTKMRAYNTTRCRRPGAIGFSPIPLPVHCKHGQNWKNSWTSCAPGTPWWCGDWIGWVVRFATSLTSCPIYKSEALNFGRCKKTSTPHLRAVDWCSIFSLPLPNLNVT